jgi:aspartate/methionine/tyrosine aminotransferase
MSEKYADRMGRIAPFHVMDLLARARQLERQGMDIVHMEIGEPDFPTTDPVRHEALRILETDPVHYTPARGLPELREAISGFYEQRYGLVISPERIIVTPGASGALQLVLALIVNPDEEVLMADPGYPCNRHFVSLLNGEPVPIAVGADSGFQLNSAHITEHFTDSTRCVLLASPSNPTGTIIDAQELKNISQTVHDRSGYLIVDEIYHGLVYRDDVPTALVLDEDVFVINSFSKYFGMTGWRLGWIVAPEWAVEGLDRLAQNLYLAAPTLAQRAALAAFSSENISILEQRRQAFRQRRDFLLPALESLGFGVPVIPEGAFYIYADSSNIADDSFELCNRVLNEVGVAITPGKDFGRYQAETHVRFAYTSEMPRLEEAVSRLTAFLGK